jgi:DNA-directed RNA polymerase III subunit RPC1
MTRKGPVVDHCPKKVSEIQFGVFSIQDTKQLSVCELYERDLYNITLQNRPPTVGGALDRRLGTSDKTVLCETCGESQMNCVGHFGVIRLCLPVFHIGYFRLMITILQNICKTCSMVIVHLIIYRF